MIPFSEFVSRHRRTSEEIFLASNATPFILLNLQTAPEVSKKSGFQTVRFTKRALQASAAEAAKSERLFPVAKRPGANAFGMMITLGRAANNDLVIPDDRISKFHAYFRADEGGAWRIHDANSSNGTFVDGQRVPTEGLVLGPECTIKVAESLTLRYLEARALYRRLLQA